MGLSINTGTEKLGKIYKQMKGVLQMCSVKMIFLWHFPFKKSSRPFYSSPFRDCAIGGCLILLMVKPGHMLGLFSSYSTIVSVNSVNSATPWCSARMFLFSCHLAPIVSHHSEDNMSYGPRTLDPSPAPLNPQLPNVVFTTNRDILKAH